VADAEIVRGAFGSMVRGAEVDAQERARLTERWWHPEIEYVEDPSWPGSSTYRGRDLVRRTFEDYRDVIGGSISLEEVREGDNGVFALVRIAGESSGAKIPWDQSFGYHCRVRDGKMSYFRAYFDIEQARRDAGVN
jgi:ketosteroid isomerase-like protein